MDEYLGTIKAFGFNFPPRGWLLCNGATLSIAQNTALFSLLGTAYGGNGQNTFQLPDLQGRVAVGMGSGAGLGQYAMGQKAGTENTTLNASNLPAHTHGFALNAYTESGNVSNPQGASPASTGSLDPEYRTYPAKHKKDRINWRSHEVLRIEAFSDAVFAFAITLLIVSLEVPKTFDELLENLRGFLPFGICFTLIFQVWHTQNIFFRRFGLDDTWTITLNGMLIFMVLFFVYPLKFLYFAFLTKSVSISSAEQFRYLYFIYSGGFAMIYLLFALMYWHAFRNKAVHLGLTPAEVFEAKTSLYQNLIMVFVGVCSVALANLPRLGLTLAGMVYILLGPLIGMLHGRRAKTYRRIFGDGNAAVTS